MKAEIMAPAGSFESLQAAIQAGANSIYFGVGKLNMRSRSANFQESDLEKVAKICDENNIKSYLTLNTIVYDNDLEQIKLLCDKAKKHSISAIIAADISVIQYANSINLEVHISTQVNVTNIDAIKFYAKFADVIVLARELTLNQITQITNQINEQNITGPSGNLVQIELFIHGALCVAISGKCYMSLAQYNTSANRGACLQSCRRSYLVTDDETGDQLKVDNQFIMSPKDLCTIGMLDKILEAGVSVLKIEGRGRSPDYVYHVVKTYKEAINLVKENNYTEDSIKTLRVNLENVFNRGFWENGYYLGKKSGEWSGVYGSKTKRNKLTLGTVLNYYTGPKAAHIYINTNEVKEGDLIAITGPTTGYLEFNIGSLRDYDGKLTSLGKKGDEITFICETKLRKNDQVFLIKEL